MSASSVISESACPDTVSAQPVIFVGLSPGQDILIGRDPRQCTITVDLPNISACHCRIAHENDELYAVVDTSANGVFATNLFGQLGRVPKNSIAYFRWGQPLRLAGGLSGRFSHAIVQPRCLSRRAVGGA